MEPVTHFLTGACLGRAGLNRKTAYATLAAVLAAEAADLDVVWGFAGPVAELQHHRGITHTFVAVPVVAAVVTGAVWLLDRALRRRKRREGATPVRWGWIYLSALIASLSHILLDWTNNYGVRPFFPFNPRWYAGSIVFIAEPLLWVLLGAAVIVPWLTGLVDREIGLKSKGPRGRGWAIFALCGMLAVWGWRWLEHDEALNLLTKTQVATAPVERIALEPYPVNPFRWHAIVETAHYYQTAEVNTHSELIDSDLHADVLYKPEVTPAVQAAKQTYLGRVYLDWGTWAVVRDVGQEPVPGLDVPQLAPGRKWTTVEFRDLRFDYAFRGEGRPGRSVLGGAVYIVDGHEEAGQSLNGREQK